MSLASLCSADFDSGDVVRGRTYYRGNRVRRVERDGDLYSADVLGRGDEYQVFVDLEHLDLGAVQVSCDCPRYDDGYACKHIYATLMWIDVRNPGEFSHVLDAELFAIGTRLEEIISERGALYGRRSPSSSRPTRKRKQPTPKPSPPWLRQLQQIASEDKRHTPHSTSRKEQRVFYVLDVGASFSEGKLRLELRQQVLNQSGWGKIKKLTVNKHDLSPLPPDDERLMAILMAFDSEDHSSYGSYYSRYYSSSSDVSFVGIGPEYAPLFLPELCATGRLTWVLGDSESVDEERVLHWDDGPPWRLKLNLDRNTGEQGGWRLSGRLHREAADSTDGEAAAATTVSLDEPILLLDGLVVFTDRIARVDTAGQWNWLQTLRRANSIDIPAEARDEFVEHLFQLPQLPPVELPADLQVETVRVEPQPVLSFVSPKNELYSEPLGGYVGFDYAGNRARLSQPTAGLHDAENNRILLRDAEREAELVAAISDVGVGRLRDAYKFESPPDYTIDPKQLGEITAKLMDRGWTVEAEGVRVRNAGSFNLSVTSGVDWFDLNGEFDFDGQTVQLPTLLKALRNKERFVQLDDGSQGMLPEEWLNKMGLLADFAGEQTEDALRFGRSQGMLLDALLAAQDNSSVDRQFAAWRKKLKSFDGIKPKQEPKSFQGELREYQRNGLGWLHFLREFGFGGCLADDMGLGKTVQVLSLLEARRKRRVKNDETKRPSLVVVPRSLVFNWIEEAERFTPELKVCNYTGIDRQPQREHFDDYDLVITTYGTLRRDIVDLKDYRFDYAILDESQAIKNAQSQAAKACRLVSADQRLAMTGTPIENHLGELWSLFEFLNPGMLGRSKSFQKVAKRAAGGEAESLHVLSKAVAPYVLRRTKDQVLTELPEKTEQTIHVELSAKERKQYDELRDHYRLLLSKKIEEAGLKRSKIHVLEALLRLRQAACHPGLIDKKQTNHPSAKLNALVEQLREITAEGHKALVFSQFTSFLAILKPQLQQAGITFEYLDGRTRKRAEKVHRFQDDADCPLFLISLKAGGHGLNLTAADYVFILDPWWNPAVEAQAVDRAHRIGQTQRVFAYRIIAKDTVEEKVLELQKSKRELAEAVVSASDSVIRQLTPEDLQMLLG